ncbi:MAG: Fic family protein, partial [Calditrichaeota bacterium]
MKPPYEITKKILRLATSISEKLGEINAVHLEKSSPELRRQNRIKTIQSSLAIEGNTMDEEQITALLENKHVVAPLKDITEVRNAIAVYEKLKKFDPFSIKSLCDAHKILMSGLMASPGKLRGKPVGIVHGSQLAHLAPPGEMVKPLLTDLFDYVKKDEDIILIKSCVFHYEFEFIHPFLDGNGRMGRLWQTVLLKNQYPVFEFLPVETLIKTNQSVYYNTLQQSDKTGQSTPFIEFMLEIIEASLASLLPSQGKTLSGIDRINLFK